MSCKYNVLNFSLFAVSRYQHEDTKRSIIRLEQGAYSYMQRAIVSHGAFAIFYGRHSKHYIKKPEVFCPIKCWTNVEMSILNAFFVLPFKFKKLFSVMILSQ